MNGHFSEEALAALQAYYGLQHLEFSEGEDTYDFTRCVRSDGSAYGTRGKCRKGTEKALTDAEKQVSPGQVYKGDHVWAAIHSTGRKNAWKEFVQIKRDVAKELGVPRLSKPEHARLLKKRVIEAGLLRESLASEKPSSVRPTSAKPPSAKPAAAKKRQPAKTGGVTKEELAELKAIKESPEHQQNRKKYLDKEKELAAKDPKFRDKARADAEKRLAAAQKKVEAAEAAEARAYAARKAKGLRTRGPAETSAAARRVEAEWEATLHRLRLKGLEEVEQSGKTSAESVEEKRARLKQEREARRKLLEKELKVQSNLYKDKASLEHGIKAFEYALKDPQLNTPENRAALRALRLLRMKMSAAERQAKAAEAGTVVKDSPKYDETPGSRKVLPDESPEEKVTRLKAKEKQLYKEREELYNKNPNDQYLQTLTQEIYKTGRARSAIEAGNTDFPLPLSDIYDRQGFNARPEVIAKRSDFNERDDILRHPNGEPIVLYRGVTTAQFADQFKGAGPNGDVHFAGQGIYGNGSYAAASVGKPNSEIYAQRTAKGYAGAGMKDAKTRVTAMAFRKDANIVSDFPGEDFLEQQKSWNKWADATIKKANKLTGMKFNDVGEAAAALGIHAYRVPQDSVDYWVILNRGAVIVAQDNEL